MGIITIGSNGWSFFAAVVKIALALTLTTQTNIDSTVWSLAVGSISDILSSLNFEKKKTIKASIEKLPEQIVLAISDYTIPDECIINVSNGLFTLERLKELVLSKDIAQTLSSQIIDICKECPDCDVSTLQASDIASAIYEKVIPQLIEDKNLYNIVNFYLNSATYEMTTNINNKLECFISNINQSSKDVNISNEPIMRDNGETRWITMRPYIPNLKNHAARENEEELVRKILNQSRAAISGVVRGIGKTELMHIICKKVLDTYKYNYIGWVRYSGDIKSDIYNSLLPQLLVDNDSIRSLIIYDNKYGNNTILFIDNVDDFSNDSNIDILSKLRCHVVITTRSQNFLNFDMNKLTLLSENEAINVYKAYSSQEPNHYINKIVKRCGYHPLAIELVAKYEKKSRMSSEAVYCRLRNNVFDLNGLVDSNWNGNKNELITAQLEKLYAFSEFSSNKQATHILNCFAILPSEPISNMYRDSIVDGKNADNATFDLLVESGWISELQNGWYMHEIIKSIIKRRKTIAIDDCTDFLKNLCAYATDTLDYKVMIHSFVLLIGVADYYSSQVEKNNLLIQIYNNIGFVYQRLSDHQKAIEWFKKAFDAMEHMITNEELVFLKGLIYNNWGLALQKITMQKKQYSCVDVCNKELEPIFELYDKSLNCFNVLMLNRIGIFERIDIERRSLIVMNNMYFCRYYFGYTKDAISALGDVINRKLRITSIYIRLLQYYYMKIMRDDYYREMTSVIRGHKRICSISSIIGKRYKLSEDPDISQLTNRNLSADDAYAILNDTKFVFDNEVLPSLISSYLVYANLLSDYATGLEEPDYIVGYLALAANAANFAIDLCGEIEQNTVLEGTAFGTLSKIHYLFDKIIPNVSSIDAAIEEQLEGIEVLELIYRDSDGKLGREELFYAYSNMYQYTMKNEWQEKAENIIKGQA